MNVVERGQKCPRFSCIDESELSAVEKLAFSNQCTNVGLNFIVTQIFHMLELIGHNACAMRRK